MKTILLVIGKTKDKHLIAQIEDYTKRIKHYVPFELQTIPELTHTKALSAEQQKEREGELLMEQIKPGDWLILLDEGGLEFTSVSFADFIQKRMLASSKRLVFVVGGPYGFSSKIYAMAQQKVSLSKMTFSHQMIRLIFTEQFYRAMTILRGEPYHHE